MSCASAGLGMPSDVVPSSCWGGGEAIAHAVVHDASAAAVVGLSTAQRGSAGVGTELRRTSMSTAPISSAAIDVATSNPSVSGSAEQLARTISVAAVRAGGVPSRSTIDFGPGDEGSLSSVEVGNMVNDTVRNAVLAADHTVATHESTLGNNKVGTNEVGEGGSSVGFSSPLLLEDVILARASQGRDMSCASAGLGMPSDVVPSSCWGGGEAIAHAVVHDASAAAVVGLSTAQRGSAGVGTELRRTSMSTAPISSAAIDVATSNPSVSGSE